MPGMVPPALRSAVLDDTLGTLTIDDSYSLDSAASMANRENDTEVSSNSGPGLVPANEVEEAIMLAQGWNSFPEEGIELKKTIQDIEKKYIEKALNNSSGNVSKTARLLKIQRTTLIEKINRYGIKSYD